MLVDVVQLEVHLGGEVDQVAQVGELVLRISCMLTLMKMMIMRW